MDDWFGNYDWLRFDRPGNGVLRITMPQGDNLGAVDEARHGEISRVWRDVDVDQESRAAIIIGEGEAFSAGGDLAMAERMMDDYDTLVRISREAREMVHNMIDCQKPIVSAMRGPAVGAGLVAGLLADIPIASKTARLIDGHTRLGVAAGDHAAIIWPLLCGIAKAKYYLLLCEQVDGVEAERIGLVARCVEDEELEAEALRIAQRLADGPTTATRWTKHTLNHWLRANDAAFDAALAYEMLGFTGPEPREGISAHREKRRPNFQA